MSENEFGYIESAPRLETWTHDPDRPPRLPVPEANPEKEAAMFEALLSDYAEFIEEGCPTLIKWLAEEGIEADTRTAAKFWIWRSDLWSASWLIIDGRDELERRILRRHWDQWDGGGRDLFALVSSHLDVCDRPEKR